MPSSNKAYKGFQQLWMGLANGNIVNFSCSNRNLLQRFQAVGLSSVFLTRVNDKVVAKTGKSFKLYNVKSAKGDYFGEAIDIPENTELVSHIEHSNDLLCISKD